MLASGGTFSELGLSLQDQVPAADYLFRRDDGGSLERGTCAMMAAEGGAGKTSLLLQLAVAVGTGTPWMEHYRCKEPQPVIGLFAEEDLRRLRQRLGDTSYLLGLTDEQRHFFHENVYLWSGASHHCSLFEMDDRKVVPTPLWSEFESLVMKRRAALLVIDPLAQFAPCAETDHESASTVMSYFKKLASASNSVLYFAHHTRKPGAGREVSQHDARGSSAITNALREQHGLPKDPDGTGSTFEVTKSNNGVWGARSRIPLIFDDACGYMPRPRHETEMVDTSAILDAARTKQEERAAERKAEARQKGIEKAKAKLIEGVRRTGGRGATEVKESVGGTRGYVVAAFGELKAEGAFDIVDLGSRKTAIYLKGMAPEGSKLV